MGVHEQVGTYNKAFQKNHNIWKYIFYFVRKQWLIVQRLQEPKPIFKISELKVFVPESVVFEVKI